MWFPALDLHFQWHSMLSVSLNEPALRAKTQETSVWPQLPQASQGMVLMGFPSSDNISSLRTGCDDCGAFFASRWSRVCVHFQSSPPWQQPAKDCKQWLTNLKVKGHTAALESPTERSREQRSVLLLRQQRFPYSLKTMASQYIKSTLNNDVFWSATSKSSLNISLVGAPKPSHRQAIILTLGWYQRNANLK